MSAFPPCDPVTLDKCVWHTLLRWGVDLPGKLLWANSGGIIFRLCLLGVEDGGVVPAEGAGIGPRKLVAVGDQRRHEAWSVIQIVHG